MTKLKEVRTSKGLSQSQLAKLCGLDVRRIQAYESGKQRTLEKAEAISVYKLAKALDCRIEDLINTEE